jgi:tetratricopeptide (TPR) repeat protein
VTRKRLILGLTAGGLTAVALLLGGALRGPSSAGPAVAATAPAPLNDPSSTQLDAAFSPQDTNGMISRLQGALHVDPDDVELLDELGLEYQQAARETGDPAYYTKSGEVLNHALKVSPNDLLATSGLGSLALSRHRFGEALVLGRKAHAIQPTFARNWGVIGDALVELGRYPAAFKAFDTMAAEQPGLASYSRIAHARELVGDVPGSIAVMNMAIDASLGQGEAEAWTHVTLSKTLWNNGRYREAARQDEIALRVFPDYAFALDALARAQASMGKLKAAIASEQEAVNRIPLPQYVSMLGDLFLVTGHPSQAKRQYALVDVIKRLLNANGVKTDLETALFDVDHGIQLKKSLALARLAQRERPSIDGDDVLAWALERNGQCAAALPYSKAALHLGTKDALKFFHRAMIEQCLGHEAAAKTWFTRALDLNPQFSLLWTPVARRAVT